MTTIERETVGTKLTVNYLDYHVTGKLCDLEVSTKLLTRYYITGLVVNYAWGTAGPVLYALASGAYWLLGFSAVIVILIIARRLDDCENALLRLCRYSKSDPPYSGGFSLKEFKYPGGEGMYSSALTYRIKSNHTVFRDLGAVYLLSYLLKMCDFNMFRLIRLLRSKEQRVFVLEDKVSTFVILVQSQTVQYVQVYNNGN